MSTEFTGPLLRIIDDMAPLTDRFAAAGYRLYLVGGVVRDHLLGFERGDSDLDATTDAPPGKIKALVSDLADAVWAQGERFGTIGAQINGKTYEITTHRAEVYADSSRKPVVEFGTDIRADLERRDFTVNAMAIDLHERVLMDPFGGCADLAANVLRTPMAPDVSFSDDPLRMLRAARFHAGYDLIPEPAMLEAIESMGERMAIVSAERIRDELQKLLLLSHAAMGIRLLTETCLLAHVVPTLARLDAEQIELAGSRVEGVAASAAQRWAALLLDVSDIRGTIRRLKPSGTLINEIVWLADPEVIRRLDAWSDEDLRRSAAGTSGDHRIDELLHFAAAVAAVENGSTDVALAALVRVAALRAGEPDLDDPQPPLRGDEVASLLGVEPGPAVGAAMRSIAEHRFVNGPMTADEARALLT
ncbi:MAG: CCA tRNA nucleotidyltransferase [Acidimicrobiales bacterium]|nr:CCA tRNA nucleotidyltransferase [Acidimicrobiales bacterium]MDG2219195.1 CCA tRNA nucleotidyltransferase [Acidimicrobiales bacterium]